MQHLPTETHFMCFRHIYGKTKVLHHPGNYCTIGENENSFIKFLKGRCHRMNISEGFVSHSKADVYRTNAHMGHDHWVAICDACIIYIVYLSKMLALLRRDFNKKLHHEAFTLSGRSH